MTSLQTQKSFGFRSLTTVLLAICMVSGCSTDSSPIRSVVAIAEQAQSTGQPQLTSLTDPNLPSQNSGNATAESGSDDALTKAGQPYPDRVNPFEFGAGVDFDAPQRRDNESLEIKLRGFVGTDPALVILHVGGKTRTLAKGEKWGVIEVVDITPPTVRINSNGVLRVWSLLGHHEQAGL